MKLIIGSDHAGFALKTQLLEVLNTEYDVEDCGTFSPDSIDYPDYADLVCSRIKTEEDKTELTEFGILLCGSAQGMAMRANKFSHIRAALVYSDETVKLSREHNNANIICIGARFCDVETALRWIKIFEKTAFLQGRHQSRVAKIGAPTS